MVGAVEEAAQLHAGAGKGTCPGDLCYPKLVEQACAATPASPPACAGRDKAGLCVPIPDGGGVCSTAAWLAPQSSADGLRELRRSFMSRAKAWNVIPRLLQHVSARCAEALFTAEEVRSLQSCVADFATVRGFARLLRESTSPFCLIDGEA